MAEIARYRFDEGSGTVLHDSFSGGDGNFFGPPNWTSLDGVIDGAELNGTNAAQGTNPNLAIGPPTFSVSLWVKNNQSPVAQTLFVTYTVGSMPGFRITLNEINPDTVAIIYANDGAGQFTQYDFAYPTDGLVHNVVLVHNTGVFRCFIDGVEVPPGYVNGNIVTGGTFASDFRFGVGFNVPNWLVGAMSDTRIFNHALTPAEALSIYREVVPADAEGISPLVLSLLGIRV